MTESLLRCTKDGCKLHRVRELLVMPECCSPATGGRMWWAVETRVSCRIHTTTTITTITIMNITTITMIAFTTTMTTATVTDQSTALIAATRPTLTKTE
jgi:hypothetical protein